MIVLLVVSETYFGIQGYLEAKNQVDIIMLIADQLPEVVALSAIFIMLPFQYKGNVREHGMDFYDAFYPWHKLSGYSIRKVRTKKGDFYHFRFRIGKAKEHALLPKLRTFVCNAEEKEIVVQQLELNLVEEVRYL